MPPSRFRDRLFETRERCGAANVFGPTTRRVRLLQGPIRRCPTARRWPSSAVAGGSADDAIFGVKARAGTRVRVWRRRQQAGTRRSRVVSSRTPRAANNFGLRRVTGCQDDRLRRDARSLDGSSAQRSSGWLEGPQRRAREEVGAHHHQRRRLHHLGDRLEDPMRRSGPARQGSRQEDDDVAGDGHHGHAAWRWSMRVSQRTLVPTR